MDSILSHCGHALDRLDMSNRKMNVTQEVVWCRSCSAYVPLRDKNAQEIMRDVAVPAAAVAGGIAAVVGLGVALFGNKAAEIPVPCPKCKKEMMPESLVATPVKLGFLARNQVFSTQEEFYKACPHCNTALGRCKKHGITLSILERISVGLFSTKTGYQYEQRCVICKKVQS